MYPLAEWIQTEQGNYLVAGNCSFGYNWEGGENAKAIAPALRKSRNKAISKAAVNHSLVFVYESNISRRWAGIFTEIEMKAASSFSFSEQI